MKEMQIKMSAPIAVKRSNEVYCGMDSYNPSSKKDLYKNMENEGDYDKKPPRVAVFLDGSNFFYMQKDKLHWFVDPKKLLNWLTQFGDISDANYYTSIDHSNEGQVAYMRALSHMGFRVKSEPLDSDDYDSFEGGGVYLDMIIDMLTGVDNYDMAVIISGDADFARIIEVLRARGKKYLVLSTKGMISNDVRSVAGMHYCDIADLRRYVEKN
jgi:uncharacterized LabA/DUF88 family protein